MYNSEHRLLYPQKRVGARGEGRFERISWDQALDEIADKLKVIRDQYGAEALAMFIGTRTGILDYRATTKMFAQLFGTPNKDGTDPFCASGKMSRLNSRWAASAAATVTPRTTSVPPSCMSTSATTRRKRGRCISA